MARHKLTMVLLLLLALGIGSVAQAQETTMISSTVHDIVELRSNGEVVAEILTVSIDTGSSVRPACGLVADTAQLQSSQYAAINVGAFDHATKTLALSGSGSIQLTSDAETAASIDLGAENNAVVMPIGFTGEVALKNGIAADVFSGRLQLSGEMPAVCGMTLAEGSYNLISEEPFEVYGAVSTETESDTSLAFAAVYGAFDATWVDEAEVYRFRLGQLPRPEGIDSFLIPIDLMIGTDVAMVSDFDVAISDGTADGVANGLADGMADGSANGVADGSANGSGDGTSNGTGNGSGDGTGDGTGNGTGDGTGNGTGDGTGNGTGDGAGNGTSNGGLIDIDIDTDIGGGDGTGDGTGNGTGDGDGGGSLIDVDVNGDVGGDGSGDGSNGDGSGGSDENRASLLDVDLDAGINEGESDFQLFNADNRNLLNTNVVLSLINDETTDQSLLNVTVDADGDGIDDNTGLNINATAGTGGNGADNNGNLLNVDTDVNLPGNNNDGILNFNANVDLDDDDDDDGLNLDANVDLDDDDDGLNIDANVDLNGDDDDDGLNLNLNINDDDDDDDDEGLVDIDLEDDDDGIGIGLNLGG